MSTTKTSNRRRPATLPFTPTDTAEAYAISLSRCREPGWLFAAVRFTVRHTRNGFAAFRDASESPMFVRATLKELRCDVETERARLAAEGLTSSVDYR